MNAETSGDRDVITPERIAEKRRIAEAAKSGLPCGWKYQPASQTVVTNSGLGLFVCRPHEGAILHADNTGAHIADNDPPSVLAMLDAIERLTAERDEARAAFEVAAYERDAIRLSCSAALSEAKALWEALTEARAFVDRHSETWYKSGQDLLARIDAALSPAFDDKGGGG